MSQESGSMESGIKPSTAENMQRRQADREKLPEREAMLEALTPTERARRDLAWERKLEQATKWGELDEKTMLANGAKFKKDVLTHIAEVNKAPGERGIVMAVIDVDNFAAFNQNHNEIVGDQALRAVADRLRSTIRGTDTAGRLGGEEFGLVLPHTQARKEIQLADRLNGVERIRKTATENLKIAGDPISLSMGEAAYIPGESYEAFYDRASKAETIAKLLGKGRTVAATQVNPDGSIIMHDVTYNRSYVYEERIVEDQTKKYLTEIGTADTKALQNRYEIVRIGAAKPTLMHAA